MKKLLIVLGLLGVSGCTAIENKLNTSCVFHTTTEVKEGNIYFTKKEHRYLTIENNLTSEKTLRLHGRARAVNGRIWAETTTRFDYISNDGEVLKIDPSTTEAVLIYISGDISVIFYGSCH